MKTCTRCGINKPHDLFQIRKASHDGLTASCKQCLSEYDKTRANLPHRVKMREDYAKTDSGIVARNRGRAKWAYLNKDKIYQITKSYREQNPKKATAHGQLAYAIKIGTIAKSESCESCKNTDAVIHGHHDDYDKPLVVRWLCALCHRQWHTENGEALNGT